MKRVKIVKKKLFIALCLTIIILLFDFSTVIQAKTPYVGDCFGEDVSPECLGEEEPTEINEDNRDEDTTSVLVEQNEAGSLAFSIVRTVFALLLILALIYILIKFLGKRNKLFSQVKALENLGGISVGQNKSIQIVRIGEKVFIVGVGDNVELLQELDDEDLIHDLLHSDKQDDFQVNHLVRSIFKQKPDPNDEFNEEPHQRFKSLFSNELEKLKENRLTIKNQQKKKED